MKIKIIAGICLFLAALIYSCRSDANIEFDRYYTAGKLVYEDHCQNCHSAKGEGLAALIPPLTDSVWLKTNRESLPCLLKNGLKAKIKIAGKEFDGQMPATELTPIEIAQVITYVTNSFGNKQGLINADKAGTYLNKCNR